MGSAVKSRLSITFINQQGLQVGCSPAVGIAGMECRRQGGRVDRGWPLPSINQQGLQVGLYLVPHRRQKQPCLVAGDRWDGQLGKAAACAMPTVQTTRLRCFAMLSRRQALTWAAWMKLSFESG